MKPRLPVLSGSPLPPLYAGWAAELLTGPVPDESQATCSDCAMCSTSAAPASASEFFFNPRTKCCTYVPALANFLVGRILADDEPASARGRASVESRLQAGVAVTPLGLGQPPTFRFLYDKTVPGSFGHSVALRCPHYLEDEGGKCGVWRHRASVCTTWFCKHVRGAVGQKFWQALHQLLSGVEHSLSRWCVLQLDVGPDALAKLFPMPRQAGTADVMDWRALDGIVDPAVYRSLWGRWLGRETEFYETCGRLVGSLKWPDVVAIGGPDIQIFAHLVREAHAALGSDEIPERIKIGKLAVISTDQASSCVCGYNGGDPLELPKALMDVLPHFDGRPTREALASIRAEAGIAVDPALVRKLVDFEILVACEPAAG